MTDRYFLQPGPVRCQQLPHRPGDPHLAADTEASVRRRPVSWPKLAWVTQRQRRGAIIGASVLLGVFAVYFVIMAVIQNNAYAAVAACHPAGALKCQQLAMSFRSTYWGGGAARDRRVRPGCGRRPRARGP